MSASDPVQPTQPNATALWLQSEFTRLSAAQAVQDLRDELTPLSPGELNSLLTIVTAVRALPADEGTITRAAALRYAAELMVCVSSDVMIERTRAIQAELDANRAAKARAQAAAPAEAL